MGKSTTNDCKLAFSMAMLVYQRVMSYLLVLSEEWRDGMIIGGSYGSFPQSPLGTNESLLSLLARN